MPESTTISFRGRDFTDDDIAYIIRIIKLYPTLSRSELAHTICEHLKWQTPTGNNKRRSCDALLERLDEQGLINLPPKRRSQSIKRKPPNKKHYGMSILLAIITLVLSIMQVEH